MSPLLKAPALLASLFALASMRAPAGLETTAGFVSVAEVGTAALPIDAVSRAKFPKADGPVVDKLAVTNRFVNSLLIPESDKDHYNVADAWVMFPPDERGDCEDYALTKLGILVNNGTINVATYKVVTVRVHRPDGIFGHALLAVRLNSGAVAYLDARFSELMTRRELRARGYEFFDWRA